MPHIWALEVANALVKAFRRQHITREELFDYAQQLGGLRVRVDPASYRELAQRRGVPITTADGNLVQAARAV